MFPRGAAITGLAAVVALSCAQACSTGSLVTKFNSGILDSNGDPFHAPADRSRDMVRQLLTHELMDGFFTQGTPDGKVATWAKAAAGEPDVFVGAVLANAESLGRNLPWSSKAGLDRFETILKADVLAKLTATSSEPPGGVAGPADKSERREQHDKTSRQRTAALGRHWRAAPTVTAPSGGLCGADGKPVAAAGEIADGVRFTAALERSIADVTAIAIEGLVDQTAVREGAAKAFAEIAAYLGGRTWRRRFDHHVAGLVIKGGASTGLYSAGVVWTALNLIADCMADGGPDGCLAMVGDPRFELVSGTSTGALVAVATELFNSAATDAARRVALDRVAGWFTCVGDNDLYCVQEGDGLAMLKTQKGLLQFDGLQNLLVKNVTCDIYKTQSELVLNMVSFRTGSLFDLSDRDELRSPNDIVNGALASAVLPFIGEPIQHLPVDYDPALAQTYLDGGIRSELPILPLVRRGAERVLVVSSDASVTGESSQLDNGLDIATRFIDVVIGGVTESEIQHAERHVESVRLAELDACSEDVEVQAACKKTKSLADCETAFCQADWPSLCAAAPPAQKPMQTTLDLTNHRLASLWATRSFFRNETEVSALHGYDFNSAEERRLFLAGAEAARVRCTDIAELLDLPVDKLGPKLASWCAPPLKAEADLRKTLDLQPPSQGQRDCKTPANVASTQACR
jgi:predicted acylesterase/phospholipase RssA